MNTTFRRVIASLFAAAAVISAAALDLPVKRVNGTNQYYYAVRKGDTVFGIARKLGISREELVRYNPSAADGLRQGETLYFPVDAFPADTPADAPATTAHSATFIYKVQRGETLFGLSHRFGVSPDDIIALNPSSNDGIKAGEKLIIPVSENTAVTTAEAPAAVPAAPAASDRPEAEPAAQQPAPAQASVTEPGSADPAQPTAEQPMTVENQAPQGSVAVLLPLMLDEETPGKQAQRASDFVKGLMLAAKEMGEEGSPVKISVYDTRGSQAEIARLMKNSDIADADVIISPEDETSLASVIQGASPEAYIFNILAVQDTSYMHHDNVVQANIPHREMYAAAVRGLLETYEGYTPVFLISKGGRSEKIAFTQYAREEFARQGIPTLDVSYDGVLQNSDLAALDITKKYVFIPASGSLSEFNKFARGLRTARENAISPSDIALFGYPDWTIFRGDAAELLHTLEATFYSRFYADPTSTEVMAFNRDFKEAFGTESMDVVPSSAMLGYDTARFIITDIRANSGVFSPEIPSDYMGLQSSFRFLMPEPQEENVPASDPDGQEAGATNSALYLITYLTGNGVVTRIL